MGKRYIIACACCGKRHEVKTVRCAPQLVGASDWTDKKIFTNGLARSRAETLLDFVSLDKPPHVRMDRSAVEEYRPYRHRTFCIQEIPLKSPRYETARGCVSALARRVLFVMFLPSRSTFFCIASERVGTTPVLRRQNAVPRRHQAYGKVGPNAPPT
jgi:hypothetical protein